MAKPGKKKKVLFVLEIIVLLAYPEFAQVRGHSANILIYRHVIVI